MEEDIGEIRLAGSFALGLGPGGGQERSKGSGSLQQNIQVSPVMNKVTTLKFQIYAKYSH